MKLSKLIFSVIALAMPLFAAAQQTGFEVDYNNPRKFILGDITVEGNHYFSAQQVIQQTGLKKGMEVTVPSDDLNAVVDRLYLQRYFEDVALKVDSLSSNRDSVYLKIALKERPRVSRWTFSGIRKSEQTVPSEDFVEWALKNDRDDLLTFGKPTVNKTAVKAALLEGEEIPAEITTNSNINIK